MSRIYEIFSPIASFFSQLLTSDILFRIIRVSLIAYLSIKNLDGFRPIKENSPLASTLLTGFSFCRRGGNSNAQGEAHLKKTLISVESPSWYLYRLQVRVLPPAIRKPQYFRQGIRLRTGDSRISKLPGEASVGTGKCSL